MNKFEIAQIMYLRPERVEVAVALIPRSALSALVDPDECINGLGTDDGRGNRSLERYSQGDDSETRLQQMLDDVRGMARYGNRA